MKKNVKYGVIEWAESAHIPNYKIGKKLPTTEIFNLLNTAEIKKRLKNDTQGYDKTKIHIHDEKGECFWTMRVDLSANHSELKNSTENDWLYVRAKDSFTYYKNQIQKGAVKDAVGYDNAFNRGVMLNALDLLRNYRLKG